MGKKLAIISTHPIQYYAPVFQLLAKKVKLKVFYTWGEQALNKYDQGFKQNITWDVPLLEGYDYQFLTNSATDQGTHHFNGIINPDAITAINEFNPDAILVYGWAWKSHLKLIRYFSRYKPIYFRGDSTLINPKNGIKSIVKKLFLTYVYKHITTAFYVGSANAAYFKEFGLKEKQLVFAPHAIDNSRFAAPRTEEAAQIRKSLHIGEEEILILSAGKLEPIKNPFLLLNAFASLALKQVHLLYVGNGMLEEDLMQLVKNEGIKNVHFMGFQNQSQMPAVYQACDLFCQPSLSETWGLAINEAMASGKAILASDKVGCAQDLITDKVGAIFKNNDVADLKQKLIALTKDKNALKTLGHNAAITIGDWSFEHQVNAIAAYVNR